MPTATDQITPRASRSAIASAREAEHPAVDLGIVRAERRPWPRRAAGRRRQLRRDRGNRDVLAGVHGDVFDEAARHEVRVVELIGDRVDRAAGHVGGFEHRECRIVGARGRPRGDGLVDHPCMRHAAVVGRQSCILGEIGAFDGAHEPAEDAVGIAADDDVAAIGTGIHVGRHDAAHRRAVALANHAGRRVLGQRRLHQVEDRLVQRDVDHLSFAGPLAVAMVECEQQPEHRVQSADRVAQAQVGARGRAVREAVDVAQSAHALRPRRQTRADARRVRSGRSPRCGP